MTLLSTVFLIVTVTCAVYALLHIVVARLFRLRHQVKLSGLLYLIFLAAILLVTFFGFDENSQQTLLDQVPSWSQMLYCGLLFSFFLGFAFMLYSAIDHSVRIRICVEFHRGGNQPLRQTEIFGIYKVDTASQRRIDKLCEGGYLLKTGENYTLTPKGRRIGTLAYIGRRLFNVRPGDAGGR